MAVWSAGAQLGVKVGPWTAEEAGLAEAGPTDARAAGKAGPTEAREAEQAGPLEAREAEAREAQAREAEARAAEYAGGSDERRERLEDLPEKLVLDLMKDLGWPDMDMDMPSAWSYRMCFCRVVALT